MTGYQEILTDPSYFKQIITLTYPHIGNTGTNIEDFESRRSFAAGLVVRESSILPSSWRNETPLKEFLVNENIIAIENVFDYLITNKKKFSEKNSLPFSLLSDSEGLVAKKYNSLNNFLGFKSAKRNTFIVNPEGEIAKIYLSVDPKTHSEMVLNDLSRCLWTTAADDG